ncbi:hypothetical protein ACWGJ9_11540 [Curtobacterium citreum]
MQTLTWILMLAGGAGLGAAFAGIGLAAVWAFSDDLSADSDRNIRRRKWGRRLLTPAGVGAVFAAAGGVTLIVAHSVPVQAALGLTAAAALLSAAAITLTYVNGRTGVAPVRA